MAALLSYGFRPFFLLYGLYAALIVPAWLAAVLGAPAPFPVSVPWHAHEMLFGLVVAAIAGFLLTSVPAWTGVPPLRGARLAALAGLWLAGRGLPLALSASTSEPLRWIGAAVDLAFVPALICAVAPAILRHRSRRNYGVIVLLAVLALANGAWYARQFGYRVGVDGTLVGLDAVLVLLSVVGGRIVPSFTRNALARRGLPSTVAGHRGLDLAAVGSTSLVLVADATAPSSTAGVAWLIAITAALHAWRLAGWGGWRARGEPIVWVLHLAYGWIPIGFTLRCLWLLGVPEAAGWIHALTVGAITTMILAVATRAALGHTGRPLAAAPGVVALYLLATLAALARTAAPALPPAGYLAYVSVAGAAWTLAFVIFTAVYAPILTGPRVD